MIHHKGKSVGGVWYKGKPVSAIYLVWQAIRSCFGAGYWVNKQGWSNKDGWKN